MVLLSGVLTLGPAIPATAEPDANVDRTPASSPYPSGLRLGGPILFSRTRSGDGDIYSVRGDGSRLRRLTRNDADDTEPAWSWAGASIVFVRTRDGMSRPDLFTLVARDRDPTLLLRNGESPVSSPIGPTIAFVRSVDSNMDIYTMRSDGTDLQRVTSDAAVDTDPVWWPDGSSLVFASNRDGDFDLYRVAPDGSGVERLTDDDLDQRNAVVSLTERTLAFEQGHADDRMWCWILLAPGWGAPNGCRTDGSYAYDVALGGFAWIGAGDDGHPHVHSAHLGTQVTSGAGRDADPAWRPAEAAIGARFRAAIDDVSSALEAAEQWRSLHGSYEGADESDDGLRTAVPDLCLVSASSQSRAADPRCEDGTGPGSLSVAVSPDAWAAARATGFGQCVYVGLRHFTLSDGSSFTTWAIGSSWTDGVCSGDEARSAATHPDL